MLFNRFYTFQSKKNADVLKKEFLGKHLKIHNLDFEIFDKEGNVKVIPHAEDDNHMYTLPITRLKFTPNEKGTGSIIKMRSKPRRIDIGGPNLLLIFILFALIAAVVLYFKADEAYKNTSYILGGISIIAFAFLWYRMEIGYFDYIRKIKKWVQEHI